MKVSIITISFNSVSTIEKTIQSVVNQDYNDIEYIIIDGGSMDGTLDIIQQYSQHLSYWVSEPDNGIYDAMNKGITVAQGDVIAILNSDDSYANDRVVSQVVKVFQQKDILAVFTDINIVNSRGRVLRHYQVRHIKKWMLRFGIVPPHPGAFFASIVYRDIGCYKSNYKISADFEFFVRFFKTSQSYNHLNIISVVMLQGGVSTNGLDSYKCSSTEIFNALNDNKIYTNKLLVWLRLPIKYFLHLFSKLH